jgi:hypothetical protein
MAINPRSYVRKPFVVDAERVKDDNIAEVAEWCRGEVLTDTDGRLYIAVNVKNPINERQSKAFVGDWVLFAGRGFKVYTNAAFTRSYEVANPVSQNAFEDTSAINERELGSSVKDVVTAASRALHGGTTRG